MSFNFAPTANQEAAIKPIPAGTIALAMINVKDTGLSKNTGCLQAQLEFIIVRGPYERRKIWMYIGDPNDSKCSEGWKPMCMANLQHMLESSGIFNPADASTYSRYEQVPVEHAFRAIMADLDGKHVAIKLKIEPAKDGNDEKNTIGSILSPNPNGRTAKAYASIVAGEDLKEPAQAAAPANAFGAAQNTAPAPATAFAQQATAAPAGEAVANTTAPTWLQG